MNTGFETTGGFSTGFFEHQIGHLIVARLLFPNAVHPRSSYVETSGKMSAGSKADSLVVSGEVWIQLSLLRSPWRHTCDEWIRSIQPFSFRKTVMTWIAEPIKLDLISCGSWMAQLFTSSSFSLLCFFAFPTPIQCLGMVGISSKPMIHPWMIWVAMFDVQRLWIAPLIGHMSHISLMKLGRHFHAAADLLYGWPVTGARASIPTVLSIAEHEEIISPLPK